MYNKKVKEIYFLPYSTIETKTNSTYKDYLVAHGYVVKNIPKAVDIKNLDVAQGYIIPPTIILESTFNKRINQLAPNLLTNRVKKALELAKKVHKNQERRSGISYLEGHLLPVSLYYVLVETTYNKRANEDLLIVCLLHDLIEDGEGSVVAFKNDITNNQICIENEFNLHIATLVAKLTKKPKSYYMQSLYPGVITLSEVQKQNVSNMQNKEYVEQILNWGEEVIKIKCIDRLLNLSNDLEFHKHRDISKVKKYMKETTDYYSVLYKRVDKVYEQVFKVTTDILGKL